MGKPAAHGEGLAPFPTTRWSLVLCAGHAAEEHRRAALDELLRRYLPALRAHLLIARVAPPGQADDLLQGFLADKVVRRDRGRFRTFVAVALDL